MKQLELDWHIGRILKLIREIKELKQHAVAAEANYDPSTLCRIEKSEIKITLGELEILAEVLQTNIIEIIRLAIISSQFSQGISSPNLVLPHLHSIFKSETGSQQLNKSELALLIYRINATPKDLAFSIRKQN